MTIHFGFFNSINGDRLYDAADMSNYYRGLVSDGVLANYEERLMVRPNGGMTVAVGKGKAFIDGKYIELDAAEILTLDQSSTNLNRIDAVMLRKENTTREIGLYVKKGVEAVNPIVPSVKRTNDVRELCLATIKVNKLVSEITEIDIEDVRMDSSRCGYVTGLVNFLDTSQLYTQWTTAFNTWFNGLVETLGVNTKNIQTVATYTPDTDVTTVTVPASLNYASGDILQLYVNGMLLTPTTEYTISGNTVNLTGGLDAKNELTFICIKSEVATV